MSSTLEILVRKTEWQELAEQREIQEFGELVFVEHRKLAINTYLEAMRLWDSIWDHRKPIPAWLKVPIPTPSWIWLSAAVLLLTHGSEYLQKRYLMAPEDVKDKLVGAVLSDGGMWCENGTWAEIPE